MKDLRIVIVSWNVEKLLDACLRSLTEACGELDWECVVVDNASKDGSVQLARRVAEDDARFSVIANAENVGFAKACNQGARGGEARYVLFLNPDTECPNGSLEVFLQKADEHPEAGIFGPKLIYPNGDIQDSVRRFPGVWDQLAIVFKLPHVFPGLKSLRRYFAQDIDREKEQDVEQVMGACFLVRRELIEQHLGFDERYFIWMEEIDFCKTAIGNGWKVRYIPSVNVIHHQGQSFAKEFHVKRQRMFTASLVKYFQKWHPGWRSAVIRAAVPFGIAVVWLANVFKHRVAQWSLFIVVLEIISALTIFAPVANSVATFVLAMIVFVLAWKRPVTALGILLVELLIGSKGQLLQFGYWPVTTSLRICLVGAFLLGWGISIIQERRLKDLARLFRGRAQYAAVFLLIAYGFVRGWMMKNGSLVAQDGNAWLDWIILIPVLDIATRYRDRIRAELVPVVFAGIFWLGLKTAGLEYIFSHGFKSIASETYLWVRRTGIGEVTYMLGNAFRIFMQSYVYMTAAWLSGVAFLLTRPKQRGDVAGKTAWFVVLTSAFVLGISLSRSMWLGTLAGGLVLIFLLIRENVAWWKRLTGPVFATVAGLALVAATLAFPYPYVKIASLVDLFGARADVGEAAAASRWHLLPALEKKIAQHPILGSGFGATVTYKSEDPRVVKATKGGVYTTYAFEWGWLEHWVKFGLLGIPVMLWLLISLGLRLWKLNEPVWVRVGAVSSLVALATLHVLTPYLNHPLGFLYFFVGEVLILTATSRQAQELAPRK